MKNARKLYVVEISDHEKMLEDYFLTDLRKAYFIKSVAERYDGHPTTIVVHDSIWEFLAEEKELGATTDDIDDMLKRIDAVKISDWVEKIIKAGEED